MENKEKRIIVAETNAICKALNLFSEEDSMFCCRSGEWVPITKKDCKKCKNPIILGITRAEAVKRMAKALCQLSKKTEDCNLCSICWEEGCNLCDFDAFAEAALDALLGKEEGK